MKCVNARRKHTGPALPSRVDANWWICSLRVLLLDNLSFMLHTHTLARTYTRISFTWLKYFVAHKLHTSLRENCTSKNKFGVGHCFGLVPVLEVVVKTFSFKFRSNNKSLLTNITFTLSEYSKISKSYNVSPTKVQNCLKMFITSSTWSVLTIST